jgi:hypothetical protein
MPWASPRETLVARAILREVVYALLYYTAPAHVREYILVQYVLAGISGIGSSSYLVRSSQLQARRERLALLHYQAQC